MLSYLALMINGFIFKSEWATFHVFLRYPHRFSIPRELPCVPIPCLGESCWAPLNLVLLARAEGQLGATSSQGHAVSGSLRRLLAPLGPLTVHRALGTENIWLTVVTAKA